ncbi:MAG: peptide-methionine (R)-S-oxide reductase MsrB [Candidatus Eremiobacteraeota bacterium]|nr:peptide-methionine (R)-S-oxide reductase MsrB [Candidatus Eremiobacteraeota bacterium]
MVLSRATFILGLCGTAAAVAGGISATGAQAATGMRYAVAYSDDQWRKRLSPDAYDVMRQAGTEAAFSSPLDRETRPGKYACAGCALALYDASTKFDSGTGWPSFYEPLHGAVATTTDSTLGMERTEVHCSRCGSHLGHVFDDGPRPTGLRYCMNGVALAFHPAKG